MNTGSTSSLVDADGSLAMELEHQPRSGDPFEGGVVFEAVAEISLVGGLGCGEYLLRMALDSIRAKRSYKFVVLQATDASKTFYERFGFVRVGAICRYERKDRDPSKPGSRPDTPIMGYRHWTHPNESDTSLQKHGGPSYMMCLKLPEDPPDAVIETPFLDEMMKLEVEHKPTIEQLGGTSTPHPKGKRGVLDPTTSDLPAEDQPTKNGPKRKIGRGRRGTNGSPATSTTTLAVNAASPPELPFLRGSGDNVPEQSTAKAAKSIGVKRNAEAGSAAALLTASAKKRRLVDDLTGQTKAGAPAKKTTSESKVARRTTRDRSNSNQSNPDQNAEGAAATETSEEETQPDGPVDVHAEADDKKVAAKKPVGKPIAKRTTPRRNSGPPPVLSSTPAVASIPTTATTTPIDKNAAAAAAAAAAASRTGPMKQKVKSYPRDRVHFYNKVVRPKKGKNSENYFVLHYDEAKQTIRIIPMEPRGILSGKRAGRPRWQAVMTNLEKDSKTVRCADYEIVKAFMVMKTPVVASEAWDVLDA
ncbi:expressed unknown protein [Seminavis robusta]|uniref:N-acetyltransferase domain-containing protein n=1 Tax=Seminavis robusta TaxID=568900 RepID=A0A9N8DKN1_9STRA|nr:expressed unknown protein [Seminavis robusta]|eukprot:Sro174_g076690.1 n/a (531) ;mRNA; f:54978-56570